MKANEIITEAIGVLYEMANLNKEITGIEPVVFCSPKGGAKHECRVKVSNILGRATDSDLFSIALKDLSIIGTCKLTADQLESAKWWIHRNRFAILDYWKDKTNTLQFLLAVKKLTEDNENGIG